MHQVNFFHLYLQMFNTSVLLQKFVDMLEFTSCLKWIFRFYFSFGNINLIFLNICGTRNQTTLFSCVFKKHSVYLIRQNMLEGFSINHLFIWSPKVLYTKSSCTNIFSGSLITWSKLTWLRIGPMFMTATWLYHHLDSSWSFFHITKNTCHNLLITY